MEQVLVFVYAKNGKIKALNIEDAKMFHDLFEKDGWAHTQTLDACRFLEYLHNNCEDDDLIEEINSLKNFPS